MVTVGVALHESLGLVAAITGQGPRTARSNIWNVHKGPSPNRWSQCIVGPIYLNGGSLAHIGKAGTETNS